MQASSAFVDLGVPGALVGLATLFVILAINQGKRRDTFIATYSRTVSRLAKERELKVASRLVRLMMRTLSAAQRRMQTDPKNTEESSTDAEYIEKMLTTALYLDVGFKPLRGVMNELSETGVPNRHYTRRKDFLKQTENLFYALAGICMMGLIYIISGQNVVLGAVFSILGFILILIFGGTVYINFFDSKVRNSEKKLETLVEESESRQVAADVINDVSR